MSHRAAGLERQLWYPNPTDLPHVDERPESALPCRSPPNSRRSAILIRHQAVLLRHFFRGVIAK